MPDDISLLDLKAKRDKEREVAPDLYMRYVGVLGVLSECSVYVPEDVRESIQAAMDDACRGGRLKTRRILDRIEIEVI